MERFLAPITEKCSEINVWSSDTEDILTSTILIWKYLRALGASGSRLAPIHPSIEDAFDPDKHEAVNVDIDELPVGELRMLKVLWTIRRGFLYQDETDGQMGIVKAMVMVIVS